MHRNTKLASLGTPLLLGFACATLAGCPKPIRVYSGDVDAGFGLSVANAEDVNGDGVNDLIIGAGRRVYMYSGAPDSTLLWSSSGPTPGFGSFGAALAVIDDVNGSGIADIVVGFGLRLFPENKSESVVAVLEGGDGEIVYEMPGGNVSEGALSRLDDVDGDAFDDFAVGGGGFRRENNDVVGRVDTFSGRDGALIDAFEGFVDNERFGVSLARLDDLDGDEIGELLIGAPEWSDPSLDVDGRAYIISLAGGTPLAAIDGPGSRIRRFGRSMSGLGDTNGDAVGDFVIGAEGYASLHSGADGSILRSWRTDPVRFGFGQALASAGDLDHDGLDDVIVGLDGAVFVYSGGSGARLAHLWARYLDGQLTLDGGRFGEAVASAGDLDGDGTPEVIVGARGFPPRGKAFVYRVPPDF